MSGAVAALLLIYGSLWPSVTGYVMQEISSCGFSDDKQGNISFNYWFTFNRQFLLSYDETTQTFSGCDYCIHKMGVFAFLISQQMNASPKWLSYVKSEEKRCKDEVRTFWNKTVERKAKPSVEVFLPIQVHAESLPVLVCHVWGFYPRDISVAWFKNDILVKNYTEAVRNGDWTYHVVAVLDMRDTVPTDNYTCLVSHSTLDIPLVKKWKHGLSAIQIIKISVASVVFALGLVFIITGIACWKNAKRSGYSPIPGYNDTN